MRMEQSGRSGRVRAEGKDEARQTSKGSKGGRVVCGANVQKDQREGRQRKEGKDDDAFRQIGQ